MTPSPSSRHLREVPPRHVDLLTQMSVLFGGTFQFMGWFFLFLGSIFCWIFMGNSEAKFWFEGPTDWQETQGMILSSDASNASENNVQVYKLMATFEVNDETYIAKGYVNGGRFSGGESVVVMYAKGNPDRAFIKDSKRAVFGGAVAFVLLFPLIGLGLIVFSLVKNYRSVRLLVNGVFTRGKLVSKSMTATRVNDRPVLRYEFSFTAGGQEHLAVCKTHEAEKVEDEEKEIILYDTFRPAYNVVYDAAPFPSIDGNGQLVPAIGSGVLRLFLPLLTVSVNAYLWFHGLPFSM